MDNVEHQRAEKADSTSYACAMGEARFAGRQAVIRTALIALDGALLVCGAAGAARVTMVCLLVLAIKR